jgi:hypothetical protein
MPNTNKGEGLKLARLMMVLSGLSPLFILWAIKGNKMLSDRNLVIICAVMVVVPNVFLWLRIRTAKQNDDRRTLIIGKAEDHRDHLLVYLFAMLLPFYPMDATSWRDVAALLTALSFVVFLFWHLNLHYMNIWYAIRGYRVFVVSPPQESNPVSGRASFVLITTRTEVFSGESIEAYRLSDTLYFEVAK